MVEALEDGAHFLCVGFFFSEFQVFFVVFNILAQSIPKLLTVFISFQIAVGHDSHDLFVVVQDTKTW